MGIVVREKTKGSGVFWVFATWQGRRRAKRVGDRAAAEAVASQLRARLALGDESLVESRPTRLKPTPAVTFETVAARWLDWYPSLNAVRPGTLANYRKILRAHLLPALGDTPIGHITRRRVQELIAALRGPGGSKTTGKPLSDLTISTNLPILKLVLDYAVEEGLIPANPMAGGPRLWRAAPRPEHVDPFTGRELRAILEAAAIIDRDFAVMLRLWVQSGMRSGEVRGLERGDLNLERGLSNVQRSLTKRQMGPTKTGRSRVVSFLHPVCEDVAAWEPGATPESRSILVAVKRLTVSSLDPAGPLFTVGGRSINEGVLYGLWRRTLTKAQVRYREPEQFRHTWASTMLSRGAPLLYVSTQGGWKTAGVLLKYYARWMPQVLPAEAHGPATQAQPEATNESN